MDALKHSRLGIAIAAALLMTACSEEEAPNTAPSILVSDIAPMVNEGDVATVTYTVSDGEQDSSSLSVSIVTPENQAPYPGDVVLDKTNKEIRFTAPWLNQEKVVFETVTIEVTDDKGTSTRQNVIFQTNDINAPVEVTMEPPQGAFGYQNTQEDNVLNMWFPEGERLVFKFNVDDPDADELSLDYGVTEGLVFRNQIEASIEGDVVTLSLPVPEITTPYEDFTLSLTVMDGDETVTSEANVTVVNYPELAWTSNSDTTLTESKGGNLLFTSSESRDYDGDYNLVITTPDGSPLDFNPSYDFKPELGTIEFGPSSGFQGDQEMLVTLTLTTDVPHAGGETYKHVTELTRQLTVIDDRDDDFNVSIDSFYQQVDWLQRIQERQDDRRVVSSLGTYLFLNRAITYSESQSLGKQAGEALDLEFSGLNEQADVIIDRIHNGEDRVAIYEALESFASAMEKVGHKGRESLRDSLSDLEVDVSALGVSLPEIQGSASLYGESEYTHYVGNSVYGFYADQDKTEWKFKNAYAYLSVADITNSYCFARDDYADNQ